MSHFFFSLLGLHCLQFLLFIGELLLEFLLLLLILSFLLAKGLITIGIAPDGSRVSSDVILIKVILGQLDQG